MMIVYCIIIVINCGLRNNLVKLVKFVLFVSATILVNKVEYKNDDFDQKVAVSRKWCKRQQQLLLKYQYVSNMFCITNYMWFPMTLSDFDRSSQLLQTIQCFTNSAFIPYYVFVCQADKRRKRVEYDH